MDRGLLDTLDVGREEQTFKELLLQHGLKAGHPVLARVRETPLYALAVVNPELRPLLHREVSHMLKGNRDTAAKQRRAKARKQLSEQGVLDHDVVRSEVVAREYARLARVNGIHSQELGYERRAEDSIVTWFRQRYLGGGPVSEPEAAALLSSRAAALLLSDNFEKGQIPAVGHTVKVITHTATYDPKRDVFVEDIDLEVDWPGLAIPARHALRRERKYDCPHMRVWDQGQISELMVYPESLFSVLHSIAERLAEHYGWKEEDAVQFLLTDSIPPVPCLYFERDWSTQFDHVHNRLHLSILPWVSAQSLIRLYRRIQREAFGTKQNRPTSVESLRFFDFVSERRTRVDPLPWRQILKEWDATQRPKDRYGPAGVQNFQRDYERIRGQVVWMRSDSQSRDARRRGPKPVIKPTSRRVKA